MQKETVINKIMSKIDAGKDVFFLFASGRAINVTNDSIKEINEKNFLKENGYDYQAGKLHSAKNERVWIFEKENI